MFWTARKLECRLETETRMASGPNRVRKGAPAIPGSPPDVRFGRQRLRYN